MIPEVAIRYFDGCPNWHTAYERLHDVLLDEGRADVEPILEKVETPEDAERLHFAGSPTILIDGVDPFEGSGSDHGLACRVYRTPEGVAGSPTVKQLLAALHRS